MTGCGNHTYCCGADISDCCSGGPAFELKPFAADPQSTVLVTSVVDHFSTVSILSVKTLYHTLQRYTPVVTVTATHPKAISIPPLPSSSEHPKISTSGTATHASGSVNFPTTFNASGTTDHQTLPDISTPLSQRSLPSSMIISQPTSSLTSEPSSSQASEAESPARRHSPKTSIGLGVGLCLILGLFFVGAMIWFIRRRRRNPQKKKLHISYPISIKPIPMFEVANTDWEMPVDREMPTEMSTNRRTEQNWI